MTCACCQKACDDVLHVEEYVVCFECAVSHRIAEVLAIIQERPHLAPGSA